MTAVTGHSRLLVVGANHKSSNPSLRDRLYFEPVEGPALLAALRDAGLASAMALATCDRVEILAASAEPPRAAETILDCLSRRSGIPRDELDRQCIRLFGADALRHLFSIAASLESLVVGEPQVLGQVKQSDRLARETGMIDTILDAALSAAYRVAKRVRTETAIGERPVSIAAAAIRLARNIHGDLGGAAGMLVGGGDMGELIADQLRTAGLGQLTVTTRIETQAQALAHRLGGHHIGFDGLGDAVVEADIVIAALGAGRATITAEMVRAALPRRRRKPVFFIDTGIPGDVEKRVNDIDGAFLYDLDDLEGVVSEGRAERDEAANAARLLVEEEVARFLGDRAGRTADGLVTSLRRHFDAAREQALADAGGDAERATHLLVSRLLHEPSAALRQMARDGEVSLSQLEEMLDILFGIDASGGRAEDDE